MGVTIGGRSAFDPAATPTPKGVVGSATSLTITWEDTQPTAGSTVIVLVNVSGSVAATSVVDNGTSVSTFSLDKQNTALEGAAIYRANNISLPSSGNYSVTISVATAHGIAALGTAYTGVTAGAPSATNSGTATSTAVNTGAASGSSGDLYVGTFSCNNGGNPASITFNSGPTFTETARCTNGVSFWPSAYAESITASGSQSISWTVTSSTWAASIAVYPAAATDVDGGWVPQLPPDMLNSLAGQSASWWGGQNTIPDQTIQVGYIDTEESFGVPAVSTTATISPVGISDEQLGFPAVSTVYTVSPAAVPSADTVSTPFVSVVTAVNPAGVPTTESMGSVSVSTTYTVVPVAIPSGQSLGTPSVTPVIAPSTITPSDGLGNPTLNLTVSPSGISDEVLGSPAVTTTVTVSPYGVGSAERLGQPAVQLAQSINPVSVPVDEVLGSPALSTTVTVSPTGFRNDSTGYPAVSSVVSPVGVSSTEQVSSVTTSVVTGINPAGIPSSEAVGASALTSTVTVSPVGVPSAQALGTAVAFTALTLSPSGIGSQEAVGAPGVSTSTSVTPTGIRSSEAVSGGSLSGLNTVSPFGAKSTEKLGSVSTSSTYTVNPGSIGSAERFGNSSIQYSQAISALGIPSGVSLGNPVFTTIDLAIKPIVVFKTDDYTVYGVGSVQVHQEPPTYSTVGADTTSTTSTDVIVVYKDP